VNIDKDLAAAPATPLVLTILSEGESYGYAILKRVRELSGGELEWADAMVYPLFHRLRRLGYLTTEWRTLPEGRRRKYYAITDDGRSALANRRRPWVTAMQALSGMWRAAGWLLTALRERDGSPGVTDRRPACDGRLRLSRVMNATPA
jgi:PadR family transcriptional regulator PadR